MIKKRVSLLLITMLLIGFQCLIAQEKYIEANPATDTITDNFDEEEAEIIDEIVNSKTLPKEKIEYFSQVTKYGFKNLFSNYSYTPTLPYTSQVNSSAASFIQSYIKQHGKYLAGMKSWGQPYFNLIENILSQYGLPKELKYIAVIESNLKTSAVSCKGAGGPWQFMPGTARQFNLVINKYTDERTDYFKSTHAAAKYLLYLYSQMKDWLLVMAAYNGGPGRVFNAIKRSGSRNFWDLQYHLPEESRTYVKRFIATHYIMEGGSGLGDFANADNIIHNTSNTNNASTPRANLANATNSMVSSYTRRDLYQANKPQLSAEEASNIEVYNISGKFNSAIIAKNIAMSIIEFNRYNPNFDAMLTSTGNYDLRLPSDKMQLFLANKYQVLNECVQLLLSSDKINYKSQTQYRLPKKALKKKNNYHKS